MYTISNLKDDLEGILHGTTVNKVTNIFSVINRGARTLLNDVDPQETMRREQIPGLVYDTVYNYTPPTDLKGNRVVDIRPQVLRELKDKFTQKYAEVFDQYKKEQDFTFNIDFDDSVKTLRISKEQNGSILVQDCDTIVNGAGTWTVGDSATNLTEDRLNKVQGSASLNFDTTGATTIASLEIDGFTPTVDVNEQENVGSWFLWNYQPVAITDATLLWGSSNSDYWSQTVTTPHSNNFQVGWNQIRFDWNGATSVGSPDASAIDYLKFSITYDGNADTDYRLDDIRVQTGSIWEIMYYSKYIFQSSTGTWKENADDDEDVVNLDTDSYNLLLFKISEYIAQQVQAEDASFDSKFFRKEYNQQLVAYKNKYKSQVKAVKTKYYRLPSIEESNGKF